MVGGIANERNGESYINGWIGGAANGAIQTIGTMVAGPLGTVIGGGLGGFTGSIIIDSLNNIGKSIKKTWDQILSDALFSGLASLLTSTVTAFMQYSIDYAQMPGGYNSWNTGVKTIADITKGFGELIKTVQGVIDDAVSYLFSSGE